MTSQENDFSANRLLFPCINPSQSSHESVDSGCCDAEVHLNSSSKPFDTFSLITTPMKQSQVHQQSPFSPHSTASKRPSMAKQRCSTTGKKDENGSTTATSTEGSQTGGGASYKYLTWREKDRRRRFREEWKHLWLVVPHGMYEVMCLVCHKIMTQRKLDTIKRHTIRRHAELLSMSESERQRLYHDLIAQYFRRGGDLCGEGDSFCATNVPRLRQTGPRGDRMENGGVRRHSRLPPDVPSSLFRARMNVPRRCEIDKPSLSSPSVPPEQIFKHPPATMPTSFKNFQSILSNGELHSIFAKYVMGLHPSQMPSRGNFDTPPCQPLRRNSLPHSCGTGTPHAFQTFKKMPPSASSVSSTLTAQISPQEVYMDPLSSRAPLDMSTSVAAAVQASPNDLSMRKCSTTSSEAGTSLTERLMRLVSTWDTAAVSPRSMATLPPPPPPPPPQLLSPLLLSTQSDASTLLLNR